MSLTENQRFYGRDGTIHRTGEVNIELDPQTHQVVAVWFRCQPLPFTQSVASTDRAREMTTMYRKQEMPEIVGVTLKDKLGEIA